MVPFDLTGTRRCSSGTLATIISITSPMSMLYSAAAPGTIEHRKPTASRPILMKRDLRVRTAPIGASRSIIVPANTLADETHNVRQPEMFRFFEFWRRRQCRSVLMPRSQDLRDIQAGERLRRQLLQGRRRVVLG